MNLAHVHLLLNHIPVVGIPIAVVFLAHGQWTRNPSAQRFSLLFLFVLGMITIPVYFTGQPAEKIIEKVPGFSETVIGPHEDSAGYSLAFSVMTGISACVALLFQKNKSKFRFLNFIVMVFACVSALSLFYTGFLGGKVRHTELRSQLSPQASEETH